MAKSRDHTEAKVESFRTDPDYAAEYLNAVIADGDQEELLESAGMIEKSFELVRGSGNVFADFGHSNADEKQLKAILAAKIIGVLNDSPLIVRSAEELTDIAAILPDDGDFSRIRKAKLDRFTVDQLVTILNRLDQALQPQEET